MKRLAILATIVAMSPLVMLAFAAVGAGFALVMLAEDVFSVVRTGRAPWEK